jgi:hypothetical protein
MTIPLNALGLPDADAGIFLPCDRFERMALDLGDDRHGRLAVPAAHIDHEPLRRMVVNGTVSADLLTVAAGMFAGDGVMVPFPGGPQLYVRMPEGHIYVTTSRAPDGWLDEVLGGAGFALVFPEQPDGLSQYILSDPFTRSDTLVRLPPRRRARPGRNAPCPCGSGLKWKRCCGRG